MASVNETARNAEELNLKPLIVFVPHKKLTKNVEELKLTPFEMRASLLGKLCMQGGIATWDTVFVSNNKFCDLSAWRFPQKYTLTYLCRDTLLEP